MPAQWQVGTVHSKAASNTVLLLHAGGAATLSHSPYSKTAANKLFFCLHVNLSPLCLVNMYKKQKNFDMKMM